MVFDGSQSGNANRLKFYLNGTLQTLADSGTIPATTGNISSNFWIGGSPDSGIRHLNGLIDDVRVYDRALTAGEISTLAGGGQ